MNLHTPERINGESFDVYRLRRAASNKAGRDSQRNPNHGLIGARVKCRDSMRNSGTMGKRQRAYLALMTHFAGKRLSKPGNKRGLGLV